MKFIFESLLIASFAFVSIFQFILLYEKLASKQGIDLRFFLISYVKEIISFFLILIIWVFGFTSLESFIPRKRSDLSTPIFFIPGFLMTKSSMYFLFLSLRNRGFENIFILNSFPFLGKIEEVSENIARNIKEICEIIGTKEVILVGHSVGGLAAKYIALKEQDFDLKVRSCITLGTPHIGTRLAYLIPFGQSMKQMRYESDFVNQISDKSDNVVSLVGEYDEFIFPTRDKDIFIRNSGHFSVLFSSEVVDMIIRNIG